MSGINKAVPSGGGGRPPGTCWARQIKSVDGFVLFRLRYFDCSDLQLFAIFMAEKLVGPRPACANSKQKETKPPIEIGLYMYYFDLFESLVYSI